MVAEPEPAVPAVATVEAVQDPAPVEMPTAVRQTAAEVRPEAARPVEPSPPPLSWRMVLLSIWGFGVALLMVRLGVAYVKLARLLQNSTAASEAIVAEVGRIAAALGCRRPVQVRSSRQYAVPFLYGMRCAILVLPERMCQPAYGEQLRGVVAHELAHVGSGDFGWNAALQAASTVLWFHPLAWRIGSAHRVACDAVCDAISASYLGDVQAYCRTLARVALEGAGSFPAAALAMARTCDVRRRIDVLQQRVFAAALRPRTVAGVALIGLLFLALLAGVRFAMAANEPTSADPSPQEIVARMAKAYGDCTSYRDSGIVTTVFVTADRHRMVDKPFTTAFVRPGRFRFEYKDYDTSTQLRRYIIWSDGKDVETWWDLKPGIEKPKSLGLALGGATGVSGSSACRIPSMLLGETWGNLSLTRDAKRAEDGKLDKVDCFRVEGKYGKQPITLWIDKQSYLVRRLDERKTFDTFRIEQTTTYDPTINEKIVDRMLAFDSPAGREKASDKDHKAIVVIDESVKQKVWNVKLVGNTIADDDLRTQISAKHPSHYLRGGEFDRQKLDDDVTTLTAYYRGLGCFQARIGTPLLESNDKEDRVTATFVIDEGPRFKIRGISVVGNTKFTSDQLLSELKLKKNEYFDQAKVNADISALRDKYGRIGYGSAKIDAEPRLLAEPGQLDLVYKIQEGDRTPVGGKSSAAGGKNSAAALIKAMYDSRAWIDSARSFRIRSELKLTPSAEEVRWQAKQPIRKPFELGMVDSRPSSMEEEWAWDETHILHSGQSHHEGDANLHRFRVVWDGALAVQAGEKQHALGNKPAQHFEHQVNLAQLPWGPGDGYHFWWSPTDVAKHRSAQFISPEDFELAGQEDVNGRRCYVVQSRAGHCRLHVGVADGQLYRRTHLVPREGKAGYNYLAICQKVGGPSIKTVSHWDVWLKSLPPDERRRAYRELRLTQFDFTRPLCSETYDDYREVAPGCWLAFRQTSDMYELDAPEPFVSVHHEQTVADVAVNQPLPKDLFHVEDSTTRPHPNPLPKGEGTGWEAEGTGREGEGTGTETSSTLAQALAGPPQAPADKAAIAAARKVLDDVAATYKAMDTYKAEGTVTTNFETDSAKLKKITRETSFSILLKKPNLYRMSWTQKDSVMPSMKRSGAAWRDGTQPFLYLEIMHGYTKMKSDEAALDAAADEAGMAITPLFLSAFAQRTTSLARLKDPKIETSEQIDGEDCYVVSGAATKSRKETYWISKSKHLIVKCSRSLASVKAVTMLPDMTDKQREEVDRLMGLEATEEDKKKARDLMAHPVKKIIKAMVVRCTSTEVFRNVSSPPLKQEDFVFVPPKDAVLKDSFLIHFGHPRAPTPPSAKELPLPAPADKAATAAARKVLDDTAATYKSLATYKAEGTATMNLDMKGTKTNLETSFSIALEKPNRYLISWTQKNSMMPSMAQSGAAWSDGAQPYLYLGTLHAYSKMTSDEIALAGATGVSGGAAMTVPALFLPGLGKYAQFSRLKDPKLEKAERIGDEDCYVVSAASAISTKETFWISKAKHFILKYSRSLTPPGGGWKMPEMSDKQLEEAVRGMGMKVTEENKKKVREQTANAMKLVKTMKLSGTSTELYRSVSSPSLKKEDFVFVPPKDAVLKDSLFAGLLNRAPGLPSAGKSPIVPSLPATPVEPPPTAQPSAALPIDVEGMLGRFTEATFRLKSVDKELADLYRVVGREAAAVAASRGLKFVDGAPVVMEVDLKVDDSGAAPKVILSAELKYSAPDGKVYTLWRKRESIVSGDPTTATKSEKLQLSKSAGKNAAKFFEQFAKDVREARAKVKAK